MFESFIQFLLILAAMLLGGTIALLKYAWRSVGKEGFTVRGFFLTNRLRMSIGLLIFLLLSAALFFIDGVGSAFVVLDIPTFGLLHVQSFVAGAVVGGWLVVALPGQT